MGRVRVSDEVLRMAKARAAALGVTLQALVEEMLRRGLGA